MGLLGRLLVGVLVLLMLLTAAGATGAFAIERTVLNSDGLDQALADEGVYATVANEGQAEIRPSVEEAFGDTDAFPAGIDVTFDSQEAAEAALTETYVAEEAGATIERVLTFVRGNDSTVTLQVDLRPLKESLREYTDGTVSVDTVALASEVDFGSATDEIVVTDGMIERLDSGAGGYTAARSNVREQVNQSLPTGATPQQRNATLEEINADFRANVTSQTRAAYGDRVSVETLEAIVALQTTVVDGLTDPGLTFEAYANRRDDAEATLETAVEGELRQRIDQRVDDRATFGDVPSDSTEGLSMVRTAVEGLELLTPALPVAFVSLAGLVFAVTRSLPRTVKTAGQSLLIVGIVGLAAGVLGREPALNAVDAMLASADGEPANVIVGDAVSAILGSLLATLTTQSVALVAAGAVLVVAVVIGQRGRGQRR